MRCDQSYGLAERLLREANQMHTAVSYFDIQPCVYVPTIEHLRHSIILILKQVELRSSFSISQYPSH